MKRCKHLFSICTMLVVLAGTSTQLKAEQTVYAEVSGQGQPAILVPGLISSGEVFDEMLTYLNKKYECHVITFAGFAGKPAIEKDRFLPAFQKGVLSYMEEQGMNSATLIGHSLGGFLSMKIAAEHPGKVDDLIILDALPFLAGVMNDQAQEGFNEAMARQYQQSISSMGEKQLRQMRAMTLQSMLKNTDYEDTVVEWAMTSDPKTEAYSVSEMMGIDLRDHIHTIEAPVLVLAAYGGPSPQMPDMTRETIREAYADQYKEVDNLTLKVAEEARHFIMYDDPDWVKKEILAFTND